MNWYILACGFVAGLITAGFIVRYCGTLRHAYFAGYDDGFRKAVQTSVHAIKNAESKVFSGRLPN